MIKTKGKYGGAARAVALVGICAATIECGKLAFAFLPNVEVVTLLVALYGYVFGWYGVMAAAVFVCIEPLIWGIGPWLLTYFIYWPLVALIFCLLRKGGVKNRWYLTAVAVGLTLLFGVLSSLIEVAFYLGINNSFPKNLVIYYIRGIMFYIVQTVTNAVLFPTLFLYLSKRLSDFGIVKDTDNKK